jgi:hypothetical protein
MFPAKAANRSAERRSPDLDFPTSAEPRRSHFQPIDVLYQVQPRVGCLKFPFPVLVSSPLRRGGRSTAGTARRSAGSGAAGACRAAAGTAARSVRPGAAAARARRWCPRCCRCRRSRWNRCSYRCCRWSSSRRWSRSCPSSSPSPASSDPRPHRRCRSPPPRWTDRSACSIRCSSSPGCCRRLIRIRSTNRHRRFRNQRSRRW